MTQSSAMQSDAAVAIHSEPSTPPALVVMVVHGTFARGMWQQFRRNVHAAFNRIRGRLVPEVSLWAAPSVDGKDRWWFEAGSDFEDDLIRRSGLPTGSIAFTRIMWSGRNTFSARADAAARLRDELRSSLDALQGVPHVVLAHSHGGTVAAMALDGRHPAGAPAVQGLLTLGTPFVRLARRGVRADEAGTESASGAIVASLLPSTLLILAPMLALDFAARAGSATAMTTAIVLLALSLVAGLTLSFVSATAIAVFIYLVGSPALRTDIPALALLATFAALLFATRVVERGKRYVEDGPIHLACPLLALRTPRDEASLIIGLGQVAQGAGHWGAQMVGFLTRPFAALMRATNLPSKGTAVAPAWQTALSALSGFVLTLGFAAMVGGLTAVAGLWNPSLIATGPGSAWLIGFAVVFYGLIALLLLSLAMLLVWAFPSAAISLAAGGEAFLLPVVTQVDAEPLPNAKGADGRQPASMALEILYDTQLRGLNHSLYDAPEVRERIVRWLRQQLQMRVRISTELTGVDVDRVGPLSGGEFPLPSGGLGTQG